MVTRCIKYKYTLVETFFPDDLIVNEIEFFGVVLILRGNTDNLKGKWETL